MSQCKTGAEHIATLRDARAVFIDGQRVEDVTVHPAFANAVASAGLLYDYQGRPENIEAMTFLPEGQPTILHVAKRDWVKVNAAAARGFAQGEAEGAAWINQPKNDAKLREYLAKHLKLPAAAAAKMQITPPGPVVTEKQLTWWLGMMKEQDMLKTTPNVAQLIVK